MLKVLFLCTANRIRSPMAEAFIAQIDRQPPLVAESAGLLDLEGASPVPEALEAARALGADLTPHRARSFSTLDPLEFDLVIGFEHIHVAAAVVHRGVPLERAFRLAEVVRLLEQLDAPLHGEPLARAKVSIALAHRTRMESPAFVATDDIEDPLGASPDAYRDVAVRIKDLCDRFINGLFGPL